MQASFGSVALWLAFLTLVAAVITALIGRKGDERWVLISRRAVYGACALLTLCVLLIELAFARDDFSFKIVAEHSSIETPAFYKMAAMWSSQEGSLLLWAWVLSIASSLALYATRNKLREIVPYATAVMAGVASFFTGLMLFAGGVNPFAKLSPVPADGIGLNPLLQHPSMMIHPPMLYSGYVAFTIPFAFAVGALITRKLDASWIRATRRFALIAWAFLGFGLLLGARWSYTELGWGGYWAWDPVENAALMPWLIGTAFLHSVMVQEKRGMLKVWNAVLIVATFSLALLGTFLVRSGVLQSIHAFGDSTVGPYILGLIGVVLIGSTALIISRLDDLRSEKRIDSLISRESVFVVNNVLLVALTRGDLLGHLLPADLGILHRHQVLAGGALVRPLHDPAGDPAGALHRHRPAAGLAPGQLGDRQTGLPRADRGGGDRRRRPRPLQRRRLEALGPGPLRLRHLRPGRSQSGVLARRRGAALAQGRLDGLGAGRRGQPQPPSLRRLHRPHRHRRAADRHRRLLQLPDQARRQPAAGPERRRRRAQGHLRATDGEGGQARPDDRRRSCGSARATKPSPCTRPGASTGRPGAKGAAGSVPISPANRTAKSASRRVSAATSGRRTSPTSSACSATLAPPTKGSPSACAVAPACRRSAARSAR